MAAAIEILVHDDAAITCIRAVRIGEKAPVNDVSECGAHGLARNLLHIDACQVPELLHVVQAAIARRLGIEYIHGGYDARAGVARRATGTNRTAVATVKHTEPSRTVLTALGTDEQCVLAGPRPCL